MFGTQKVVCVSGNSPGIDTVGTSWEKANVVTETVIDISSECPSCTECPKDGFDKFLSLPTVRNHTKSHNYSTFVFVTRSAETSGGTDVSRCMDIDNKYVSILIINQVNEEDNGKWEVGVNSLQNSRANADIIIIAGECSYACTHPHTHTHHFTHTHTYTHTCAYRISEDPEYH